MKKVWQAILIIVFLVGVMAYLIITAVMDLTNTQDKHTVHLDAGFEILSVEHSINGLIPIGTDHYYIAVNEKTFDSYLIHCSPSWFGDRFNSDGYTFDHSGIDITSLCKKLDDYDVRKEIYSRASTFEDLWFPYGTENCFEIDYQLRAVLKLVLAALIAALGIVGRYIVHAGKTVSKAISIPYFIALLAAVVLGFAVMR